jgi:Zn-dependent protease
MPYSSTPYDIYFRFSGFPVRIHPLFWLVAALLGIGGTIDNLPLWFLHLALWILAVFVSVLIHELGHALVFRYVLGVPAQIVLCIGGVTIPSYPHQRRHNWLGFFNELLLFAAGPFAGFALAGLVVLFFKAAGVSGDMPFDVFDFHPKAIIRLFLSDLFLVSVIWGIFNLFPIYPMDGGHIAREILCFISPYNGVRFSLLLSIFVSAILLVLSLRVQQIYLAMMMGYFIYQNYQEFITFRSFR